MNPAEIWRTRVDPEWTGNYGVREVHVVFFEPNNDRGGVRDSFGVCIPEVSRQHIRLAIRHANKRQARLVFACDTCEQAEHIASYAAKRLPAHQRIAYERAVAGAWGCPQ